MEQLEEVLKEDDKYRGSFGTLERKIAYATLISSFVPVLLIPIVYKFFNPNIYKTTLVISFFFIALAFIIYFRFAWIISLSSILNFQK